MLLAGCCVLQLVRSLAVALLHLLYYLIRILCFVFNCANFFIGVKNELRVCMEFLMSEK